jgi:hypothetical protein
LLRKSVIGRRIRATRWFNPGYKKSFNAPVIWPRGPVLPEKIFLFFSGANHRHMIRVSSQQEGRLAIATNAGRDAVDAEVPITNGTIAYGEVVWS